VSCCGSRASFSENQLSDKPPQRQMLLQNQKMLRTRPPQACPKSPLLLARQLLAPRREWPVLCEKSVVGQENWFRLLNVRMDLFPLPGIQIVAVIFGYAFQLLLMEQLRWHCCPCVEFGRLCDASVNQTLTCLLRCSINTTGDLLLQGRHGSIEDRVPDAEDATAVSCDFPYTTAAPPY
jgi:hypothetical protein